MPEAKQIVFVDTISTPHQDKVVSILLKLGYAPFVDAVHGFQHSWYLNNVAPCPHKLYTVDLLGKRLIEYEVADLPTTMTSRPDLVIYFNHDEDVSSFDWYHIRHWLRFHLLEEEVDANLVEKADQFMMRPVKQIAALEEPVEDKKEETCYTFVSKYLEEDDIMLYEVRKPFTDLPYTSIQREFSKKGHTRFFSSLFVCSSWGVSRFDVPFLEYVWKHQLKMEGVFDMDRLLQEATEACYPREGGVIPEPEPEVYRRSLEEVIVTLEGRKKGIQCGSSHDVPPGYSREDLDGVEKGEEDVDMFLDKDND